MIHRHRRSTGRFAAVFFAVAFLAGMVPPASAAAPPRTTPKEKWYGVFLGGKRAGYMVSTEVKTPWRGKPAILETTRVRIDLRVMGAPATTESLSKDWSTPEGMPLEEVSTENEGGRVTRVRAVYTPRSVTFEADLAGLKRKGTLTLKPGEKFWSGDPFKFNKRRSLETRIRYKQFNTTTLTLEDADVTIGKRTPASKKEIVDIGGLGVAAFKVPLKLEGTPATAWVDKDDEVLCFEIGPARMVRLPKNAAMAPLTATVEVTDVSSYRPDKPIENARGLRAARYRIDGLTAPLETKDDDVQTVALEKRPDGAYSATVTITTGPGTDAPPTPLSAIPREAHRAYLQPTLYVPSDDREMMALAQRILGAETDARLAAEKLSAWVYKNLTYDAGASPGLRHGAEILKNRRGVCEDYATLLVTLARAAGIPAKHCGGLVYGDGKFYLHAWAQLWVGKWVAYEPTWGAPFADATHIKLEEGEPSTRRKGASVIDAFKITVLDTGGAKPAAPSAATTTTTDNTGDQ